MSFLQNVFTEDFISDRHLYLNFEIPANRGRGNDIVTSYGVAPFNLSGNDAEGDSNDTLGIGFAIDPEHKLWTYINVDLTTTAISSSSVSIAEIVGALNSDAVFYERFEAINNGNSVQIRQKRDCLSMKFYILNNRAETKLKFNEKSGIAEVHSNLEDHLIENRFEEYSLGILLKLDPSNLVDAAIISGAKDKNGNSLGFNPSSPEADSDLLKNLFV